MKKIIVGITAIVVVASAFAFTYSTTQKNEACKNTPDCVCCPCTPDCQPGDANCICPADCKD